MALLISDNNIVFSDIDAYCSCMLGCRYLACPDYLIIKAWIRATVLFPLFVTLTLTNICVFVKIYPGMFYCGRGQCGMLICHDYISFSLNYTICSILTVHLSGICVASVIFACHDFLYLSMYVLNVLITLAY